MLRKLLPREVVLVERLIGATHHKLAAAEEDLVATAIDKRRREFAAGRACTRQGLEQLGLANLPVMSGKHGEPIWPPGIVGSITHTDAYVAAAVGRATQFRTLGIDVEIASRLNTELGHLVFTEHERRWLLAHRDAPVPWPAVIFSAKESFYKAYFPLHEEFLDCLDVNVWIYPDAGTFAAAVRRRNGNHARHSLMAAQGRFATSSNLVATAIALKRSSAETLPLGKAPLEEEARREGAKEEKGERRARWRICQTQSSLVRP